MKLGALASRAITILLVAGGIGHFSDSIAGAARHIAGASSSCRIKGNISINTGERIYHVPGQEHYAETRISPEYGERWFCTEADARAAGWRRAKR